MLQSCTKPRASCAAASRLAPRCRMAVLPRPAGATTATVPMSASQHTIQQLQQGSSRSSLPPSRLVPARCSGTGTGGPARGSSGPEGEARSERDLPQPDGDIGGAETGSSSPEQPADTGARPADAKASRQQQAAEVMLPLLQEALRPLLRPLLEGQVDIQGALKASQQQQLDLVMGLVEQQLQLCQEKQRQQQDELRQLQEQSRQLKEESRQLQEESRQLQDESRQLQEQRRQQEEQRQDQEQQQLLTAFQGQEELLRQLLATASAASGGPSQGSATAAAIQVPPEQVVRQAPKLLQYVRFTAPLGAAQDGVVLGTNKGGARVKVWSLSGREQNRVFGGDVPPLMEVIAKCDMPRSTTRRVQGVPVTRFTAAPGMLVRRGYDVKEEEWREAAAGEVGVLQPSPDMGDTCLVEWASGSQRVYETGNDGRFELVHLEMSKNSGAPVVGEDWTGMELKRHELLWDGLELKRPAFLSMSRAVGGTVVERGTHWTYGGAEPGLGSITKAEQAQAKPGCVPVKWRNGQRLWHRASPASGYDLCYSAWVHDPVTLFTAREGLQVETTAAGGARVLVHHVGELVRPEGIRGNAVLWQVKFSGFANTVTYAVEASQSTPESGSPPDVAKLRFF